MIEKRFAVKYLEVKMCEPYEIYKILCDICSEVIFSDKKYFQIS